MSTRGWLIFLNYLLYLGVMPRYFFIGLAFTGLLLTSILVAYWYEDPFIAIHLIILCSGVLTYTIKSENFTSIGKWIKIYILLVLAIELLCAFSAQFFRTNMVISHFAIPVQLILLVYIYFKIWKLKLTILHVIPFISILLLLASLSISQGLKTFASAQYSIFATTIIVLALFEFRRLIQSDESTPLRIRPEFWFNISSLVFFSVNFFVYSFLWMPGIKPSWTYDLIMATNLVCYPCYLVAVILDAKTV